MEQMGRSLDLIFNILDPTNVNSAGINRNQTSDLKNIINRI